MKAILFQDQTLSFAEKPKPSLSEGEVLVKVTLAGICSTDIELFSGYYGFSGVAGHEFLGTVAEAPGRPELKGRRVVAEINCGCGACPWCLGGDPRHCPDRKVIGIRDWDGCFAEYVKAPADNVHLVHEAISVEAAVFAEPLAAALEISQQVHINARQRVAVLGDGKLGLLIALALSHYNPGLILIGRHEEKLEKAGYQGVRTIRLEPGEVPAGLAGRLGLFDLVVEATGRPEGINYALCLVRPRGVVAAKTTSRSLSQIDLAGVVVNEISIIGSRCGDFDLALSFLKNGWLDPRPLIEAIYTFSEFEKAFEHARRPGAGKILLKY